MFPRRTQTEFLYESGFRLTNSGLRHYRYLQAGEPCVEVQRYMAMSNITLNFLADIEGVNYADVVKGATNMLEFLRFFKEAANALDPLTGRPALDVDDVMIIADNLPVHHGKAENAPNDFFDDMSIELPYLPISSSDLNPAEEAFSKMNYLLKYCYRELVCQNLELAVLHVVQDIGPEDLPGYFRHTNYLNV